MCYDTAMSFLTVFLLLTCLDVLLLARSPLCPPTLRPCGRQEMLRALRARPLFIRQAGLDCSGRLVLITLSTSLILLYSLLTCYNVTIIQIGVPEAGLQPQKWSRVVVTMGPQHVSSTQAVGGRSSQSRFPSATSSSSRGLGIDDDDDDIDSGNSEDDYNNFMKRTRRDMGVKIGGGQHRGRGGASDADIREWPQVRRYFLRQARGAGRA
jgi:hypothetical protein